MKLDKFVMRSTRLTKQQVTTCIESGEVTVNQQVITDVRYQVHENNLINYQGEQLIPRAFRYLMFNKPANTICSNVDGDYPSILNQINIEDKQELHIAGRLDADTTGLVLITDDGRWSFNIMRPEQNCEKTYRVTLSKPLANDVVERFEQGVLLSGEAKPTLPAKLKKISVEQELVPDPSQNQQDGYKTQMPQQVLLTITEGRYHQVKRMFFSVGNRVNALHREQIGQLKLDIPLGHWRYLTQCEVNSFIN